MKSIGKHDIAEGKSIYGMLDRYRVWTGKKTKLGITDIHVAFNYGQSTGSPQMLRFITEHTEVWDL